jgi:hypothetical protein
VPALRTEITEIVTGLATLGFDDPAVAVAARPAEVRNVGDGEWCRLAEAAERGDYRVEFAAAWANGQALLRSREGLRDRRPLLVEWKGPHAPRDDSVPTDLRIDHVFLVSCKYLSKILVNAAPASLFDGGSASGVDWYLDCAPDAYQELYASVRSSLTADLGLPPFVADLTSAHRAELARHLTGGFTGDAAPAYRAFASEVARASSERWRAALPAKRDREALLWRLLRIGSAPYFILGASGNETLRLRIATRWDWRQRWDLRAFDVWGDEAGQPVVRWQATVRDREAGEDVAVDGHVEVRWSHGRFAKQPEAKVYLDTPHRRVPGYVPLV